MSICRQSHFSLPAPAPALICGWRPSLCCTALVVAIGLAAGSFTPDTASRLPGALQWQPQTRNGGAGSGQTAAAAGSCTYFQYSGAEVRNYPPCIL